MREMRVRAFHFWAILAFLSYSSSIKVVLFFIVWLSCLLGCLAIYSCVLGYLIVILLKNVVGDLVSGVIHDHFVL